MSHLNKRGQNLECGLSRTLLHISEALDEARNVSDKSVGKPMGLTIMFRNGDMARLPADAAFLREWKAAYKDRDDTGSLDHSDIARHHVRAQLLKHRPRPSAYRRSRGQR